MNSLMWPKARGIRRHSSQTVYSRLWRLFHRSWSRISSFFGICRVWTPYTYWVNPAAPRASRRPRAYHKQTHRHCYVSDQSQRLQNDKECDVNVSTGSTWQRRVNESWNHGARIQCTENSSCYQTCKIRSKTSILLLIPSQMEISFYWKHIW